MVQESYIPLIQAAVAVPSDAGLHMKRKKELMWTLCLAEPHQYHLGMGLYTVIMAIEPMLQDLNTKSSMMMMMMMTLRPPTQLLQLMVTDVGLLRPMHAETVSGLLLEAMQTSLTLLLSHLQAIKS